MREPDSSQHRATGPFRSDAPETAVPRAADTDSAIIAAAPLHVEAIALRGWLPGSSVIRAGMRARNGDRVRRAAEARPGVPFVVAGLAGGVREGMVSGDVVVADEVRSGRGSRKLPSATLLAAALRAAGYRVHTGPVVESPRLIDNARGRFELAESGAVAVDLESNRLLNLVGDRPVAVVRVVVDTPRRPLRSPSTISSGRSALSTLRGIGPVLRGWAAAAGQRTVVMASPRSFCAGVERAVEIVERVLDKQGPPVYVRRQIVHNTRVVDGLTARGAVFVEELDEVPAGATVVFSAHGVAPAVREQAQRQELDVVDATCPLVSKVHKEANRFAKDGHTVFLIGHAGHDEVEGTLGEEPEHTVLVQRPEDVAELDVPDPQSVSYLTQTTLAVEEAEEVADALRERFPALRAPSSDDICYATTNRQHAIRDVARRAQVVIVAGSRNSSNSVRLVEVAERAGARAYLVDEAGQVELDWLAGVHTVGISAGASAPQEAVDEIVTALSGLGNLHIEEHTVTTEQVNFGLPKEVRNT